MPHGFVCPQCGGRAHSRFLAVGPRHWQCARCRRCSGTLCHASKLPLAKWVQAIYLVTQSKNNLCPLSLKRHLRVSHATGWRVKHKRLEAMRQGASRRLLKGVVFADDAVLRGEHAGTLGRGSKNKSPFIAALELEGNGYPRHLRLDPIADYTGATLSSWTKAALHPSTHRLTDGCANFSATGNAVAARGAIILGNGTSSDLQPLPRVNAIIPNSETAITGTYHHFDFQKYHRRYLVEAQYRVNRRFDLASLVGRLAHTYVCTAPCPEHWLRRAQVAVR